MSQFFKSGNGGGGGGDVDSLTPDVGAPVTATGGTIPTLGYDASTVETMRTYNDGAGNFRIADQTWQTQYVVDGSTTPGLKGTFQTIPAALAQIVIDNPLYATIAIRPGVYADDFVISSAVPVFLNALCQDPSQSGQVQLTGIITTTGTAGAASFENIQFPVGGAQIATFGASWQPNFYNCFLQGDVSLPDGGVLKIEEGTLDSGNINIVGGALFILNSRGGFVVASNSCSIQILDCNFVDSPIAVSLADDVTVLAVNSYIGLLGATTEAVQLLNCYTTGTSAYTGAISFSNYATTGQNPFNGSETISQIASTQGNLIFRKTVSTDYTVLNGDYYIGVTDTSSARTITLPTTSTVTDVSFEIKDESLNSSINNITIIVEGGALIDGLSSYIIASNGNFVRVIFDGTNYFTF